MKKATTTALAMLLCLIMVISAFAVIPMGAESATTKAESKDVLWSVDFDDYKGTTNDELTAYLISKGINRNSGWLSITNGKLKNQTTPWNHRSTASDTFRDLFYGLYTDENGKAVTDYYMTLDYTLLTPNTNYTKGDQATSEATVGTDKVKYTVYSPYRGESYFNPSVGGQPFDDYFFKVSSTGYLYTPNMASAVYFKTADGANKNLDRFVYTKTVNGKVTEDKAPMTQEVWEEMKEIYGNEISFYFDKTCTGNNGYQLEIGVEYTIRVKLEVDSSKKVVATTYVRPANSNGPFTKVGSCDYKCNNENSGVDVIRFSENHHIYTFDNMAFVNTGKCSGEHEFPAVLETAVNQNGFNTYTKMNCLKCGAVYFTDCSNDSLIESYDFTKMTEDDYAAFKKGGTYNSNSGNVAISAGNGLAFTTNVTGTDQGGPEIVLNLPSSDKSKDYKMSFTTTIQKLPCDQINNGVTPGSSFLTDRTGEKFNILLRLGRNADYDTTRNDNEGWLKLRTVSGNVSWKDIPSSYTIKEGETYTFEVIFKPSQNIFDLYINGDFVATGGMVTSYWTTGAKPYYRIGNMMQLNMVLKDYSFAEITTAPDYVAMNGSNMRHTLNWSTMKFQNDPVYGAIYQNVKEDNGTSSYIRIVDADKVLKNTPYTISFDFMMTSNGEYRDSANTDPSMWSLISWLNAGSDNVTKYGSIVRIGALDNDETKQGFEKFFVVMNANGDYIDTEPNGNQGYTSSAGGEVVGYYSDKKAVYSFEAGEWVTFTLAVNPIINSAYLYINGELVADIRSDAIASAAIPSGTLSSSSIRIGDAFRKLFYDWAIKDIEVTLTPDKPIEVKDSGTLVNMDFGGVYTLNGSLKTTVGSAVSTAVVPIETYKDTASANGYIRFLADGGKYAAGATNLYNLSLTSQIGTGLYYNHLDNSKYAIETTFALYDRVPTEKEYESLNKYNTENNKTLSLPTKLSGKEVTILRLSKYADANRIFLLDHNKNGLRACTLSGYLGLYTKNANGAFVRVNAWYTESDLVNGRIPDSKWVKTKTVVDETTGTFSVYVNDSIAYYLDGSTYKRAENLTYKIDITSSSNIEKYPNSPESIAWKANPTYASIPRVHTVDGVAKAYGNSGISVMSYMRLFQNCLDFSVQNVKITKLDKGLNFVGTQVREESETPLAFDLRFVFATDDVYVDAIEYDVTATTDNGEGNTQTAVCNTVYKTIKSGNENINTWKQEDGEYFSIFNVNGIELGNENTRYTFRITPNIKKYNSLNNNVERDEESATVTHVITVDGFGKMVDYKTETPEYANIKTIYTPITSVPYKALGRTQVLDGVLVADWSASGIEFNATCLGDVSINVTSNMSSKFTVVVDGVERKDVTISGGNNVIASGLPYGDHSFKIMNQSGYSGMVDIAGVTIRGEFGEKPADSELLIEFIGDSITHGCGLGSPNYSAGTNDGTLTYAFVAAEQLGADYTIMANGGMGVKWGGDYDGNNLNRSMAKYPYLNDTRRGSLLYEGYTRTADIVVIGLSTNDNYRFYLQYNNELKAFKEANPTADEAAIAAHMNEFKATKLAELGSELKLLIAEIEKNHGKDVPIVLARGMMEKDDTLYITAVTYMTDLIENTWGGKYGDHVLKVAHLTPDRTGYEQHPTREGAALQGAELADFIKAEFPELVG